MAYDNLDTSWLWHEVLIGAGADVVAGRLGDLPAALVTDAIERYGLEELGGWQRVLATSTDPSVSRLVFQTLGYVPAEAVATLLADLADADLWPLSRLPLPRDRVRPVLETLQRLGMLEDAARLAAAPWCRWDDLLWWLGRLSEVERSDLLATRPDAPVLAAAAQLWPGSLELADAVFANSDSRDRVGLPFAGLSLAVAACLYPAARQLAVDDAELAARLDRFEEAGAPALVVPRGPSGAARWLSNLGGFVPPPLLAQLTSVDVAWDEVNIAALSVACRTVDGRAWTLIDELLAAGVQMPARLAALASRPDLALGVGGAVRMLVDAAHHGVSVDRLMGLLDLLETCWDGPRCGRESATELLAAELRPARSAALLVGAGPLARWLDQAGADAGDVHAMVASWDGTLVELVEVTRRLRVGTVAASA